ncbi:N/A [soil metagenome]
MPFIQRSLLVALITSLSLAQALADDRAKLSERVERLALPMIKEGHCVGLAIGLIIGDEEYVYGFGEVARECGQVPNDETIFEIGSITKVYTGLLLADMVVRKEVRLDEPVRDLLPESVAVPKSGERQIRLLDLVTHTSGLPRLPNNMPFGDPENPYADYTVKALEEFLSSHELRRRPGDRLEYSNLGFGLLGHALALRAGVTYEQLVQDRINIPLGMTQTSLTITDEQAARFAQGYNGAGSVIPHWDIPTFAGAGGLRSTVQDQLRFLKANLRPGETPIAEAIRASHVERFHGEGGRIASGWLFSEDGRDLWHNGETGGFHSYASFRKDGEIAVVVLSNSASFTVDRLGVELMRLLTEESGEDQDQS